LTLRKLSTLYFFFILILAQPLTEAKAQSVDADPDWILPEDDNSPSVWGIQGGIVFSLWPHPVEPGIGGPRGLIRIGHNFKGKTYMINFISVEPVVNGEMEFSEISPSRVDNKIGKFMWAGNSEEPGRFRPKAITRGNITHPDPGQPDIEQLSLY